MRNVSHSLKVLLFSFMFFNLAAFAEATWVPAEVEDKNKHIKLVLMNSLEGSIVEHYRVNTGLPEEVSLEYKRLPRENLMDGAKATPGATSLSVSKFALQANFNASYSHKPEDKANKIAGWELNPSLRFGIELNQQVAVGLALTSSHAVALDSKGKYNNLIGNSNFVGVFYVAGRLDRLVRAFAAGSQLALYLGGEGDYRNESEVGASKGGYSGGIVFGTSIVINFKPVEEFTVSPGVTFNYHGGNILTSDSDAKVKHWLSAGPRISIAYQQQINRDTTLGGAVTLTVSSNNEASKDILKKEFKDSVFASFEPVFKIEYRRQINFITGFKLTYGPEKWLRYAINLQLSASF